MPERERLPHAAADVRRTGAVVELDWVKGLAILGVIVIHANPMPGSLVFDHLIERAVYVFVVLFGTTSELWWRKHARASWVATTREWYRARFARLVVPVWAVLAVIWTVRLTTDRLVVAWPRIGMTFLGYLPWIGTGWFITLVLELVVLFPLVRAGVDGAGVALSILVSLLLMVASHVHYEQVIAVMRYLLHDHGAHVDLSYYYFFWICPLPRVFSLVMGIVIARRGLHVSRGIAAAAWVAFGLGAIAVRRIGIGDFTAQAIMVVTDVPLTIALIATVRALHRLPAVASTLAWYGRHSWGVYLGQLLVHEIAHLFIAPEIGDVSIRWAYFFVLVASGTALVPIGEWLRDRASALGDATGLLRAQRA